ncbi:unnamed protein product [Vitrella brassicaformis CCMP3155]|uniref:Uncharacterized protein n=1 Tax=Vitrella brassicaformis (strain CCMP3155) TaxID=1169540 RepID=A0A0G4E9J6_VITBC|nr:unnamed protein product [Vitrella brassicaformis CCMP3155]|eukprot:CEL92067.1 unnamed protein product [Vitrella brassicaformis CCMP3155]
MIPGVCGEKVDMTARLITDAENLDGGIHCNVTLDGDALRLTETDTDEELAKYGLDGIKTPILLTPSSKQCTAIRFAERPDDTICLKSQMTRDKLWVALNVAILCRHVGEFRTDLPTVPTPEEKEALVFEGEDPDSGIHVHLPNVEKAKIAPQVTSM